MCFFFYIYVLFGMFVPNFCMFMCLFFYVYVLFYCMLALLFCMFVVILCSCAFAEPSQTSPEPL